MRSEHEASWWEPPLGHASMMHGWPAGYGVRGAAPITPWYQPPCPPPAFSLHRTVASAHGRVPRCHGSDHVTAIPSRPGSMAARTGLQTLAGLAVVLVACRQKPA